MINGKTMSIDLLSMNVLDIQILISKLFFVFLYSHFHLLADLMSKTLKQTEDRVSEVKRRAEEAVNDVKRQAVIELQKAVCAAEEKANDALAQAHQRMDKAVSEARRQATDETLTLVNKQENSREVSMKITFLGILVNVGILWIHQNWNLQWGLKNNMGC